MTRLVALDLPAGDQLLQAINEAWSRHDVILPLDQRMPVGARRRLASELGADIVIGPDGSERAPQRAHDLVPLQPDDALIIATSGTTGRPKGVVHTHMSLRTHATMVGQRLNLDAADHWWLCLPPAHIGGFGVIARAMQFSSRLTVSQHPDNEAVRDAAASGATRTAVVPTLIGRHDFRSFTTVLVGGARSHSLPANAISTYGLTESCGGVVYDGLALTGVDVRVIDGEIQLRTKSLARTYRHAPIDTVDGWLRTGDAGHLRNGMLHIEGRRDDVIVTGGNKVWPHVVEQRLREHPLVGDVVVRGVPDPEWGSLVCAWVVPRVATSAPTLEMLRGHVKESLASYCAPRRLVLIDVIPRSSLGKVMTAELPK